MSNADNGDRSTRQRTRNVRWGGESNDPKDTNARPDADDDAAGSDSWPDLDAIPSANAGTRRSDGRTTRSATSAREPNPMPIPTRPRTATPADAVRIGLWGSSRSGKTTFLSALPLAAQNERSGRMWRISGIGDESTRFLSGNVDILTRQRRFPEATLDVEEPLQWAVSGEDSQIQRRPKLLRREDPLIEFVLELQDVPGEVYKRGSQDTAETQQVIGNLAKADGLIYLFDPLADLTDDGTDSEQYENFVFFNETLHMLLSRVRDLGRLEGGRLPHHLAVCLTKFDDQDFFEPAIKAHWVNQDQHGSRIPYVPADQTRGLFNWVCDELIGGTAPDVRDGIDTYFDRDRVRVFVTSAIGFRLNANSTFDYRDYSNVHVVGNDRRIRSRPSPMNVLEPMMWLERQIRRSRARTGKRP